MSLHRDHDDSHYFSDVNYEEDGEELKHRKRVRRMLEDRLERKRLKEELDDELDEDFEWDQLDK